MPRDLTLAEMEAYLFEIADYYTIARKSGDGSYMCSCPLHGGSDSLHLSSSDRILVHCFGKDGNCTQADLQEKLKIDGFDLSVTCTEALAKKGGKKATKVQNVPAHDQTPIDIKTLTIYDKGTSWPVTQAYPYTDAQGKVIFYVLRATTTEPKKSGIGVIKHIRPYSSFKSETGQDHWDQGLTMEAKRPLYNLKEIFDRPEAPILLVEGEKTADAAKLLFPDYVVTTYAFGMGNYSKADFTPLKGRNAILWPDNSEAGIKNFLNVASLIDPKPKIVMTSPLMDRPANWDLADEVTEAMFSSQTLLERAQPVAVNKVSPEGFDAAAAKYNAFLRVLKIGGSMWVYDIRKRIDDSWLAYDYTSFGDITKAYSERIINPLASTKAKDPFMFAVKAWELDEKKQLIYGITYDPSTTDEIVLNRGQLPYVNKFMGFDCAAKPCDPSRYMCFEKHIRHIMDKQSADYMMAFFAHIIQKPKQKPGVLPILIGGQATGKTIIGKIIRAMLGYRNVYICDGRTFNSKWSGQFSGKLLIVVNEYTSDKQDQDFMNTFITDNFLTLEHKGKPIVSEESYHRVIGTTNNTDFKLSLDDRRYFPIRINNPSIDSAAKTEANKAYFNDLDRLEIDEEGLSGLHDYLAKYQTSIDVQLVPQTQYRYEGMKPVNPVHGIILEICESGSLPEEFGLTYLETQFHPYTPQYPSKLLRKHLRTMVKVMTKMEGPKVAHFLMDFLAPKHLSKDSNIAMKFVRHGRSKDVPEVDNDRVFELPPLEELRKLYNELVDPKRQWGPVPLRVVKDADNDDDSPI